MVHALNNLRIAYHFNRLIKNPARTEEIFKISEIARRGPNQKPVEAILAFARSQPELMGLYERQYDPELPTLEKLSTMPVGTLGHAYYVHLKANGLRPDFFPREDVRTLIGYYITRARQTHDIWHVLSGYDTSVVEELALQGFTLAQTRATISSALIAMGLLQAGREHPEKIIWVMEMIAEGFERGQKAQVMIGVPWEDRLGEPLERLREEMGIPNRRVVTPEEFRV
jgi:ubiquinone biosynthesis protein Coq4